MAKLEKNDMLRIVQENITRLENKDFNLYFFVLDTKGNPSSALEYIYQTAYVLHELGYKVTMLHQEKEFVGVGEWLGERYANLPHANIEKDNVEITPSDFLFIPEIFANVMIQVSKLPCKKIAIVQDYTHIPEFMPVSKTMDDLGFDEAIVTSEKQAQKLYSYFPAVKAHVVPPSIKKIFTKSNEPQKLVVNVISREQEDISRIIKPFYWQYPLYKWVSFRDLRGVSQDVFAQSLREAALTIWLDDKTPFGYTLLEALRSGGVVAAKTPTEPTDWMVKDGELSENILWFTDIDDAPKIIASLINAWTTDTIPEEVYEKESNFNNTFTEEEQKAVIEQVYVKELIEKRLSDFKETQVYVKNNVKDKEE